MRHHSASAVGAAKLSAALFCIGQSLLEGGVESFNPPA